MKREFGEKSYRPVKFEFSAVFFGSANMEYQNLFNRKLPGNILASAYRTPMTVHQLAVELGVASAYLEDEIAVLEKYNLLTALPGGKYQTRLIIFTEEFMNEFYQKAEQGIAPAVKNILADTAKKLPRLRELQFIGSGLDDNSLLWDLLFEMIREGWMLSKAVQKKISDTHSLYSGLNGICYGHTYEVPSDCVYKLPSCAGYCQVGGCYAASYADFGILPDKNRYTSHMEEVKASLDAMLSGEADALLPVVTKEQKGAALEILQEEISAFASLFDTLCGCARSILQAHAPESVSALIDPVLANVLFFKTVSLFGVCAVRTEALTIPEDERLLGGMIYATE